MNALNKRINNMTAEYSYFEVVKGKICYDKFINPLHQIWTLRIELISYFEDII